jgi:cell division protein FtsQ
MVKKKIIRKILVLTAWFLVICGLGTLLVAANRKQKDHLCREVRIGIKGTGEKFYIEKEDVLQLMTAAAHGALTGRPVSTVDLARLENILENNAWIRKAELYIDNKDVLHVSVSEREPIARVFTTGGGSFYIDSSGHRMPLLEKISARVPVVTGYPDVRRMNASDSTLLEGVKQVAGYIYSHPFWNAQVGEIDITPDRRFELIPVVGDHVIRLGDGDKVESKLQRLYVFYQQVMSKVGFNKYAAVDVQYEGQVVAVKKGPVSAVDSIQLQKNIEELMNKASMQQAADDEAMADAAPSHPTNDSTSAATTTAPVVIRDTVHAVTNRPPPKPVARTVPPAAHGNSPGQRPRAVMQRRQ